MLTKDVRKQVSSGPWSGRESDLEKFFGTKKAAERFLKDFTQAREEAIRDYRGGAGRCHDCTFPEQFWDGRFFLDSDDQYDIGLNRVFVSGFDRRVYVEDSEMECDIHLIQYGRRRLIVIDWTWKEDEYALDAWWLD